MDVVDVLTDATRGGFLYPALILRKSVFGGCNSKLRTLIILLCSIFDLITEQTLSGACGRKTEKTKSKVHF